MRLRERIRLHVLTGFLGSGKSTLLRSFLHNDAVCDRTAVLINEFGAVAIDHALVRSVSPHAQSLAGGCACCSVDSALVAALLSILIQIESGRAPNITDIVLETSGMADPSRILGTIASDITLAEYLQIASCVTCVEVGTPSELLDRYPEMRSQIACASRLVLTKPDLYPEGTAAETVQLLASMNPLADVCMATEFANASGYLFSPTHVAMQAPSAQPASHSQLHTFQSSLDSTLGWPAFSVWLTALMRRHGDRILRFKGVIPLPQAGRALVLQSVRHRVSEPEHLELASDRDSSGFGLVFICDGDCEAPIRASLEKFRALAERTVEAGM
jgi:G3E family GTPase